jgi:nucleoside-triphosphatase THEP1
MTDRTNQDKIYLVTGSVQGGKTTYLSKLSHLLKEKELKVGGFLCPGSFKGGERAGFRLKNIGTEKELDMASASFTPGWTPYRRFWFNPEAFRQGSEWIRLCLEQIPDVVIIDEVGPMELEGSGWTEPLEALGKSSIPVQIWNVREKLIGEVKKRWSIPPSHVFRIEETDINQAATQLFETVIKYRK